MIAAINPTIVSQLTVSINSSLMRQAFELLAIAQKKGMEQVSKKEPLPGFPRRGPFEFLVGDILRIPALVKSLLRGLVPAQPRRWPERRRRTVVHHLLSHSEQATAEGSNGSKSGRRN